MCKRTCCGCDFDSGLTAEAGEVVLMRTRAAESAGDAYTRRSAMMITFISVELETRTQAFAIERDALMLAAAESAACIKALQGTAAAAEARLAQQARELQDSKAIHCINSLVHSISHISAGGSIRSSYACRSA